MIVKDIKFPPGKGQLFYSKSKVYLHPTNQKRDNIPGYLTIVKPFPKSDFNEFIIAFIPESDLEIDDKNSIDKFDLYGLDGDKFDFYGDNSKSLTIDNKPKINEFINRPRLSSISSYAFGLPIGELYSIQVRPKTTNLWQGSIIFHPKYEMDQIPPVFFHDDESPGTKREEKLRMNTFEPFSQNVIGTNALYWGGDRFISCLKYYCDLKESPMERGMFLVNSNNEDAFNFIPNILPQEEINGGTNYLDNALNNAKWSILTNLANVTGFAKKQFDSIIENDSTPSFIKKLIENNKKNVPVDFDSANIYLAKWALKVQEEAERSRKMIIGNGYYNDLIKSEFGNNFIELTPNEVSMATRHAPIQLEKWESYFDSTGRLQYTTGEVIKDIFHSGVEPKIRDKVWPFLLGVYPWDSSKSERLILFKALEDSYIEYKNNWKGDLKKQKEDLFWKDQRSRILKDVKRTDREIELYKQMDDEGLNDDGDENEEQDFEFKNPNLNKLRDILFTYNELNFNLGYVQGMSDLLSPLYYIFQDEVMTFWAFTRFMERMERNFIRDLSGMKTQMVTLTELVQFMLPDLYIHLEKCDSSNLFFFFRMLLVWFKRELSFNETMQLWEVLWTDLYSSQFILFVALAILQKNSKIIIGNLHSFEDILKYTNDLNGNHDIGELLTRAELLFIKFRQMVELIDRKNLSFTNMAPRESVPISENIRSLLSRDIIIAKEEQRTESTPFG